MTSPSNAPLRVGISRCLLGESVRHDGGHKRDRFLTDELGPHVEWVPVCPEVEAGMPVPRPAIHLYRRDDETLGVRETKSHTDHTATMQDHAAQRVRALAKQELCGFVLKKSSPSCGMERVTVHGDRGSKSRNGRGVFASALLEHLPLLPVEEEGRLNDPALRENFVERLFAYQRLRALFHADWTVRDLVAFQAAHKLQLMAHAPALQREVGRIVADAQGQPRDAVRLRYESGFMRALKTRATPKRNVNALQHALGYLRKPLDAPRRQEIAGLIDDYGAGLVPLVVPITLIAHHVRHLGIEYLAGQTYLEPHPKELMLRNHV